MSTEQTLNPVPQTALATLIDAMPEAAAAIRAAYYLGVAETLALRREVPAGLPDCARRQAE